MHLLERILGHFGYVKLAPVIGGKEIIPEISDLDRARELTTALRHDLALQDRARMSEADLINARERERERERRHE